MRSPVRSRPAGCPHAVCVDIAREAIAADDVDGAPARADAFRRTLLTPVVNATGVLLHTNLGRAPVAFSQPARAVNVEFDLATGERGSRQRAVGQLFARLCGAEAAMIVNNNAAAVLLVTAALAHGRQVLVSRGESVEIGGSFRVPEVMEQSGAVLVDVGTTNRTRLADYQRALSRPAADVALVLKIHPSNYRVEGFVEETPVAQLATLGVPVVADIGSGLIDAGCPWLHGPPPSWLAGEPAAVQSLADGASLVTFSADKLLGGPQAGIIAGDAALVGRVRSSPARPRPAPRRAHARRAPGHRARLPAQARRRAGALLADGGHPRRGAADPRRGARRPRRGRGRRVARGAARRRFRPRRHHGLRRGAPHRRPPRRAARRRPADRRPSP